MLAGGARRSISLLHLRGQRCGWSTACPDRTILWVAAPGITGLTSLRSLLPGLMQFKCLGRRSTAFAPARPVAVTHRLSTLQRFQSCIEVARVLTY